ncbi:MAG: TonB C-terminal domain-containing protein, partial [Desulfovibrionaceae bacterium]|nr:TonB C-terminal domain-containing protein [Desulfovibrionaceae bacterium]
MTFLSPARALVLTGCLAGSLAVAGPANAASVAVADAGGGYSGKVLEKVIAVWAPPKSLKGEHSLAVRATIDESGKLQNCTTTRKSGLDALDVSACAAVRKAAPFGT